MKHILLPILSLLSLLALASCVREDDIDEIFTDRSWYMIGGELNDVALNSEVKSFYRDENDRPYGRTAYYVHFSKDNFSIMLSPGEEYVGTWKADGRNRTLMMHIKNVHSPSKTFDRNIYSVLKNIKYYEGDTNYIILYADKNNFIRLNNER